jgi:hypothetical protein
VITSMLAQPAITADPRVAAPTPLVNANAVPANTVSENPVSAERRPAEVASSLSPAEWPRDPN